MSRQTFMDIAVLVDAQGDMLNNIESQVIFHHFAHNVRTTWSSRIEKYRFDLQKFQIMSNVFGP
jgi:hypothetical protein